MVVVEPAAVAEEEQAQSLLLGDVVEPRHLPQAGHLLPLHPPHHLQEAVPTPPVIPPAQDPDHALDHPQVDVDVVAVPLDTAGLVVEVAGETAVAEPGVLSVVEDPLRVQGHDPDHARDPEASDIEDSWTD